LFREFTGRIIGCRHDWELAICDTSHAVGSFRQKASNRVTGQLAISDSFLCSVLELERFFDLTSFPGFREVEDEVLNVAVVHGPRFAFAKRLALLLAELEDKPTVRMNAMVCL
jgi:hypothetical protein